MINKTTGIFIHIRNIIYSYFTIIFNYKTTTYFLFLVCFITPYANAASNINKNDLKAAYLYKIIKFIEWPDGTFNTISSTFNLCIVGKNIFESYFYGLFDQQIQGHTLHIKYLEDHKKITDCHMLYIAIAEEHDVIMLIKQLQNLPILTISDSLNFAKNQGMIGFIVQKNRIGLEINLNAAHSSHISIRAELIEVAHKVITLQEGL